MIFVSFSHHQFPIPSANHSHISLRPGPHQLTPPDHPAHTTPPAQPQCSSPGYTAPAGATGPAASFLQRGVPGGRLPLQPTPPVHTSSWEHQQVRQQHKCRRYSTQPHKHIIIQYASLTTLSISSRLRSVFKLFPNAQTEAGSLRTRTHWES